MNIENKEIEVGEVRDDGLRLWCAKLALEYAKDEANRLIWLSKDLKNRANNLLGWVITLIILVISLLFTHREFFSSLNYFSFIINGGGDFVCCNSLFDTMDLYSYYSL